ncbi:MAG: hypothetical protein PWR21_123 [Methanoculleus sp.]|nr:hypothetical protein [Methanoculleus sp.]
MTEAGKRRIPKGDDALGCKGGDLRGEGLAGAHPDEIGWDDRLPVLPKDAPDRVDEEGTFSGEEFEVLPARPSVEPEQREEVLREPAGEGRGAGTARRVVAVVPEVGVARAPAVGRFRDLAPSDGPGRGLGDEEHLHATGSPGRGPTGIVGQEIRQENAAQIRAFARVAEVGLTHRSGAHRQRIPKIHRCIFACNMDIAAGCRTDPGEGCDI